MRDKEVPAAQERENWKDSKNSKKSTLVPLQRVYHKQAVSRDELICPQFLEFTQKALYALLFFLVFASHVTLIDRNIQGFLIFQLCLFDLAYGSMQIIKGKLC